MMCLNCTAYPHLYFKDPSLGLHILHLLDRAESDFRFVVQIEADVGRSEAELTSVSICTTNRMSGEALPKH